MSWRNNGCCGPLSITMSNNWFQFKQFTVQHDRCAMKVGTDGVVLGAWAQGGNRILDVGTGSGIVAMMMAQRYPLATVYAIDIDTEACLQASENFRVSPFAERIYVSNSSVQDFENELLFDSIVSNPPYFVDSLRNPDGQRAVARHTDTLSFDDLCKAAYRWLAEDGTFSVIVPAEGAEAFESSAIISGFFLARRHLIKTTERKSPKRCLMAFVKQPPVILDRQVFTLFDDNGDKTPWYRQQTDPFYL